MRVLERVYFIHATQHCTFDTCRDKILLPSIVRIRVPRISLEIRWKFVQQHANTRKRAIVLSRPLPPSPLRCSPSSHSHRTRHSNVPHFSRYSHISKQAKKKMYAIFRSTYIRSIKFHPFLSLVVASMGNIRSHGNGNIYPPPVRTLGS